MNIKYFAKGILPSLPREGPLCLLPFSTAFEKTDSRRRKYPLRKLLNTKRVDDERRNPSGLSYGTRQVLRLESRPLRFAGYFTPVGGNVTLSLSRPRGCSRNRSRGLPGIKL